MTNEEKMQYIIRVVTSAQKTARTEGIKIGSSIAHPDDPFVYKLKGVKGTTAIGVIPAECSPTGKEITKEFPLDEIFDINLACKIAGELPIEDIMKGMKQTMVIHIG